MRIGILTLPLHTNYGGILQAYALQTVLERMGHEVVVLDRTFHRKKLSFRQKMTCYPKRFIKKYLLFCKDVRIFQEEYVEKVQPIVEHNTRLFINRYLHVRNFKNCSSLSEKDLDAIVVGSDQIWRPTPHQNIYDAFLEFAKTWHIRRVAYAASFGTDEWEFTKEQTEKCKDLVHMFDKISVRERSGVKLCSHYFGLPSTFVLDPTMLLDKEDYVELLKDDANYEKEKVLLVYILDMTSEKQTLIDMIAKEKKLQPLYVSSKVENLRAKLSERIQPPVENWLQGFKEAEFVITDSFHACVFSIIFGKQFLVYGNKSRGLARFESLLSVFKLESRYISSLDEYHPMSDVDFSKVDEIRRIYRDKSFSFLLESLQYNVVK